MFPNAKNKNSNFTIACEKQNVEIARSKEKSTRSKFWRKAPIRCDIYEKLIPFQSRQSAKFWWMEKNVICQKKLLPTIYQIYGEIHFNIALCGYAMYNYDSYSSYVLHTHTHTHTHLFVERWGRCITDFFNNL